MNSRETPRRDKDPCRSEIRPVLSRNRVAKMPAAVPLRDRHATHRAGRDFGFRSDSQPCDRVRQETRRNEDAGARDRQRRLWSCLPFPVANLFESGQRIGIRRQAEVRAAQGVCFCHFPRDGDSISDSRTAASKHGLVNSRFQKRLPNGIPSGGPRKRPSSCPSRARIGLAKTRRNATISANSPALDRLRITRRARRALGLSIMKKQIRLNAFAMNCVAHQSPGLWTHPRDRTAEYNRLPYWIDLARTLERGRFDGLFLADVLGVYDVFGDSPDAALRNAAQTPANEPLMLIPAMAAVTQNLGFGVTSNLSFEPPYPFARRMSTLDHLTEGRIGWNVVTGYLDSAARGAGKEKQTAHDDRYDIADEYMEVVYKLWEGSWEDDAVLRDRARGIFTDPAKVHRVTHEGNNYRLNAIHLSEPSPQRTPVLYQAGTSPRGRQFAAQHAECVFMSGPSAKIIGPRVAAIRELAAKAGRNPAEILMFSMFTVILGRTEAEAKAKYDDYRSHVSPEGALTLMSGWTGVDFSTYDLDQQVRHIENDAGRSAMDNVTRADPDRVWTVREVAQHVGIGGAGPVAIGTPGKVADTIEAWFEQTDVDGLNMPFAVSPGDFEDIADMLVPELTRRGRYKTAYAEGTLREKLFGAGRARLTSQHPATQYRPHVKA